MASRTPDANREAALSVPMRMPAPPAVEPLQPGLFAGHLLAHPGRTNTRHRHRVCCPFVDAAAGPD